MRNTLSILFALLSLSLFSQEGNRWQDHLSYRKCFDLNSYKSKILVSSEYSVFTYDTEDNSISKISKIHGLSGEKISAINSDQDRELFVIAYIDGTFSILGEDGQVSYFQDIKTSSIAGSKKINDIEFKGPKMYLACDFGIVEFNLDDFQFGDSFFFGPNGSQILVNDICISADNIYAATDQGVYSATLSNPLLVDYRNWGLIAQLQNDNYNSIASVGQNIFANRKGQLSEQYALINGSWNLMASNPSVVKIKNQGDNVCFISKNEVFVYNSSGQLQKSYQSAGNLNWNAQSAILVNQNCFIATDNFGLVYNQGSGFANAMPSGPSYNDGFRLNAYPNSLYLSYGAYNGIYGPQSILRNVDKYNNNSWSNISTSSFSNLRDIVDVVVNPNDVDEMYFVSWGGGVSHNANGSSTLLDHNNSGLQKLNFPSNPNYISIRIGGGNYDKDGNIWFCNAWDVQNPFVVKTSDNQWHSFSISETGAKLDNGMSRIFIDQNSNKWVGTRDNGLWVFNENGTFANTSDDSKKRFTTLPNMGSLPSNDIRSVVVDKDGVVWIGSSRGLVVFNELDQMYSLSEYNAKPVVIDENGVGRRLLGDLFIKKIVVDGSNNKWFATETAGVYYTNYNGQETIYHFTSENSPLLSNNVIDIAVDPESGMVYFQTTKGLVSFQGNATQGGSAFGKIIAYPNPVRPDYQGDVYIKGFTDKTIVKITDVNGNVIFETSSNGGQAVWNRRSFDGSLVGSGVYFVFALSQDGNQSAIAKILIVN